MKTISGKELNKKWGIGAEHVLAHKDGEWYHYLEQFPGALCDINGYVIFKTNKDYASSKYLVFGEDVHVPDCISNIPGYIRIKGDL